MICRNCGAEITEGSLFCRKCGTSVPAAEEPAPEQNIFQDLKPLRRNLKTNTEPAEEGNTDKRRFPRLSRRVLLLIGAGALLLVVLAVVIIAAVSCKKPERFTSPETVKDAVVSALERGDGKRLSELAKISEPVLGKHPETFGDGDTPEAVMRGYYDRMADGLQNRLTERYGRDFRLESATETRIITGTEIFEPNRALGIEAAQYAEMTGMLSVDGETVASIRIVAAELDGEWKLAVVYVY